MSTTITNDLSFSDWATETCSNHPEILENMLKSSDILTVVIAKRILAVGGSRITKN
jgi:hypothetical protein